MSMSARTAHLAADRQLQGDFYNDGRHLILFAAAASGVIQVRRQVEQKPDVGDVPATWTARMQNTLRVPATAAA